MIKVCAIAEGYFFFHWQVVHRFAVQNLTLPPSMSVAKVTEYVYYVPNLLLVPYKNQVSIGKITHEHSNMLENEYLTRCFHTTIQQTWKTELK